MARLLVDQVDDPGQHVGVGVGRHPVAEVEHVAGQAAGVGQDAEHPVAGRRPTARTASPGRGCPARRGSARPGVTPRPAAPGSRCRRPRRPPHPSRPAAHRCPTPKWIRGTPAARPRPRAPPPSAAAPARGSRPAAATRPRSRTAAPPAPRPRPARAGTCPRSAASRPSSACQRSGSPYISALVFSWPFDGPPSTRYDARVNGAPAKPISGVGPSSASSSRTASATNGTWSGVSSGSRSRSAAVRNGSRHDRARRPARCPGRRRSP